jgi:hypothetical protein
MTSTPGVYLFYKWPWGGPSYVGRSDTDLLRRMQRRGYRYYRFKPCATPEEAYRWECHYWHRHAPRDNRIHPARPTYSSARCPDRYCVYGEAGR